MRNMLIFHHVNGSENIQNIMNQFYPELTQDENQNACMIRVIEGMNKHSNAIQCSTVLKDHWLVLPTKDSNVYQSITQDRYVTSSDAYFMGTSKSIHQAPNLSKNETKSMIEHLKEAGGPESFSLMETYHDWLHEFKEDLDDHPVKNTLAETTKYVVKESGEKAHELFEATREYDKALKHYGSISHFKGKRGATLIKAAEEEVVKAHAHLQKHLLGAVAKKAKKIISTKGLSGHITKGLQAVHSPKAGMALAKQYKNAGTFLVESSTYTKWIGIGKFGKVIGAGVLAFNIGVVANETYETYKEGGDWEEKATEGGLGIVGGTGGEILGGAGMTAAAETIVSGVNAVRTASVLTDFLVSAEIGADIGAVGGVETGPGLIIIIPVCALIGGVAGAIVGEKAVKTAVKVVFDTVKKYVHFD